MATVSCACGCGQTFEEYVPYARKGGVYRRKYVHGHSLKNHVTRNAGVRFQELPDALRGSKCLTARKRTRDQVGCQLVAIGGCLGRLEVHHLDGDWGNNEPTNLLKLCSTHHKLVESGRVDLANPVMPVFYMEGRHRRYLAPGETKEEDQRKRWAKAAVSDGDGSPGSLTVAQAEEVRAALRAGGVTQSELGARYGVSQGYISRLARTDAVYAEARLAKPMVTSALTNEQVRVIRAAYDGKRGSQAALALAYGVGPNCISRIIRGLRYRDA